MKLKKGFLKPDYHFHKNHLRVGIILGTVFSLALYGLFYIFREALRIFTGKLGGLTFLELSSKENFYYNLFFGSIAAVLGVCTALKFVIENSIDRRNRKFKIRSRHILNEQGFLFWTYLVAFSRMAFSIGFWYIIFSFQFEFNFFEEFKLLMILIPLVLFLNIWPSITRTFGRQGYKWFMYSFGYVVVISFAFANLNFTDYKKINKKLRNDHIELVYDFSVPLTHYHQTIRQRSLVTNIYVLNDSMNPSQPLLFWNNIRTKIRLDDITHMLNQEKRTIADYEKGDLIANLHIDEKVSLSF